MNEPTITQMLSEDPVGVRFWFFWAIKQPQAKMQSRTELLLRRMRSWLNSNSPSPVSYRQKYMTGLYRMTHTGEDRMIEPPKDWYNLKLQNNARTRIVREGPGQLP